MGNLLLARQMRVEDYARLSLAIALFIVVSQVATLGYSQVALRERLHPGRSLLLRLLVAGVVAGTLAAAIAGLTHGVALDSALLVLAIGCGTLVWVSGSALLREGRKRGAYLVQTSPDWVLLSLGLAALLFPRWATRYALEAYCLAVAVLAFAAWMAHRAAAGDAPASAVVSRRLLVSTAAIVAGSVLVIQFERLAVGFLLDAGALAMFSVLASIAVFPFRLVTTGTGFVLVPGLRRMAGDLEGRRRLVRRELQVIGAALAGTTLLLCLVAPAVARWITAERYAPTLGLVLAACLAGSAKVCHGIPRAIITACGSNREMERLSRYLWLGIALSMLGALLGMRAGLIGVLCGIAAGSIVGALPSIRIARRVLEAPAP